MRNEFNLTINELVFACIGYGDPDKPVIVALHGWLDNAASFELMAEHLTSHYIIAIDFIGHGQSSHRPASQPYYIWDNVTDLALVLNALNLTKVVLLGHSMGAGIAMLFAACFPQRVEKLLLIEGLAPLSYSERELPKLMSEAINSRLNLLNKKQPKEKDFELLVKARMCSRFAVSQVAAQYLVKRGTKKVNQGYVWSSDPALVLPSVQRLSAQQVRAFLSEVSCPTYIYLGSTGLANELWYQNIEILKDCETKVFDGNHHLHMQTQGAQLISEAILATY